MSENLSIVIKTLLSQDIADIESQIKTLSTKIKEKLSVKLQIDASQLDILTSKIEEANKKINNASKTAIAKADQGEMYEQVRSKIAQLGIEMKKNGGQLLEWTAQTKAKTGEITGATVKYADSLGRVKTELYSVVKTYEKLRDESGKVITDKKGNAKTFLSSIDLENTTNKYSQNIGVAQKEYFNQARTELGQIHKIKKELIGLDDNESDRYKLLNKQLKEHENNLNQILGTKIKISKEDETSSLSINQQKALNKLIKNNGEELDRLKAKQGQTSSKSSASVGVKNIKDIELNIQRVNNALEILKVNKDKVFADPRVVTEVNRLKEMEQAYKNGSISLKEYSTQMNTLRTRVAQVSGEFKNVNKDGYSFTEMVSLASKKIAIWGLSTSLVYGSLNQIKLGLNSLRELDSLMVEINKVTDMTVESMENLKNSSFDVASKYGRTAQDYLKSVAEFSRAGYEEAAQGLSEVSILAQNVGELTSDQANAFLLATDAAYKFKGSQEELTRVLDGVNQIDNEFATSIQKVSEGMTVVGSIAANSGVKINQLAAAVGTMTAATQRSGNEMGRAFRGILMNITQVKGVTDDGDIIDDEALSKSAKALDSVNIKVHEMRNGIEELRNPMDVLKELADKWSTIDSMTKSSIIESIGGKYRGNALVALLQNFDMYEKMLFEYTNGIGSSLAENEKRMDSWQAKVNQLSNTLSSFWNNTIDTNFVKGIIDSFNLLIKTLDFLINNPLSSFILKITLVSTALYGLTIAIKALTATTAFGGLTATISSFIYGANILIYTIQSLTAGAITLNSALNLLKITMLTHPLFFITVGVTTIYAIVKGIDAITTSAKEAKEQLDALKNATTTLSNELKNSQELQQSYDELSKKENKSAEDKQQLLQVTKDLSDIFPGIVSLYDEEGNAIEINSKKLEKYIKLKEQELQFKKEELAAQFRANESSLIKGAQSNPSAWERIKGLWQNKTSLSWFKDDASSINIYKDLLKDYEDAWIEMKSIGAKEIRTKKGFFFTEQDLEEEIAKTRTLLNKAFSEQKTYIEEYKRGLRASLDINENFKNLNTNVLNSFVDTIGDNLKNLSEKGNKVDILDLTEWLGSSDQFISKMNEINKQFEINKDNVNLTEKQYKQWRKEAVKSLSDVLLYEGKLGSRKLADDLAKGMIDGLGEIQVATNKAKDSLTEYEKALSDFQAIYKDNASKIKDLKGFLDEINDKGLTQSSISKIISDYQDYIPLLENESELRKQLVKDTEDYQNAIYDAFAKTKQEDTNFYNSIKNNNKSLFDNLSNFYKNDVSNWTTLAQAKITINSSLIKTLGDQWEKYFSAFQAGETISYSEYNKLSGMSKLKDSRTPLPDSAIQQFKLLDELNKAARKQAEAFKNLNVSSGLGKSSSSSSKSFEKTFEVWKEALEAINAELETLKDQLDDVNSFEQKTEIYDQMILLLQKKQSLILDINNTFESNLKQAEQNLRSYIGKGLSESDFNKIMSGSTDTIEVDIKNEKIAKAIEDFKKLKDSAEGLKKEIQGIDDEIRDLSFAEFKINLSIEDNKLSDLTQEKENLRNEMSLLEKGSAEYIALLEKENQINIESVNILRNKIALTQQELASDKYSADQKQELINTLKQLKQEYINLQFSIKQQLASIADEIIQIYKNIYEKQKQVALDAIDEQMKAEDKRHKQATDNLDDELKQFEDYINERIKALDKEENEHDYNRELEKKQKAILETQKQINILSLDDSFEAKAKKAELAKQLAEQQDEITEYQHDHSIDLRKENLKDQLDVYKKDIDAKKKAEDTKLNLEKDRLDRIKRETERYYDELINDERKFAQIKTDILNGNIDEVKNAFGSFKTFVNSNLEFIGNSITANLITKMEQAMAVLQSYQSQSNSIPDVSDESFTGGNTTGGSSKQTGLVKPGMLLTEAAAIAGISVTYDKATNTVKIGNLDTKFSPAGIGGTHLNSQNRIVIDEIDNIKRLIKMAGGDVSRFHDGGIVGNESFGFVDKFNKFFNTSANEHIIKALTNEILIPPKNITKFLIPNMQKLIANMTPQLQLAGGGVTNIYHLNMEIGTVQGNREGGQTVFKEVVRGLKSMGK